MKNIFITGVSRGIGKALAQTFLEQGDRVVGTSLSGAVDYEHENLTVLKLDVTKDEDIQAAAAVLQQENIQLDVLINNAGVLLDEDDDMVKMQRLRGTLEVNLFGAIAVAQGMLPLMKAGGTIINISSSAGQLNREVTSSRYPGYKISKTALNMYTVCLAKRLEKEKITVSAVHPGWVKTDMGGEEADLTPSEAAEYIYEFAQRDDIETGKFWFRGESMQW